MKATLRWLTILLLLSLLIQGIPVESSAPGASPTPTVETEPPTLEQLELAIQEKGLSWRAKEYNKSFSFGLLPSDGVLETPPEVQDILVDVPAALDWRTANGGSWVSSVKNQGPCGSCWAFASVGVLESILAINRRIPDRVDDLSEQILVSCVVGNYGCGGGWMNITAEYLKTTGTYYESCYAYEAVNGDCDQACGEWPDKAFKIGSYAPIYPSIPSLKKALQDGPIQVGFAVHSDFLRYESGVYELTEYSRRGYHAVMCVGYMDVPGEYGGGYFINKNSWGSDWGEDGYFRIGYSQVSSGTRFGSTSYEYELYTCYFPVISK